MLLKRLFACAAFALTASETLPAVELTHRWSFNGDYFDSVGGADAVKCGTYVSLYSGRGHMGYGACSHGTGYVDLGTNMLDTTAATIEIWARHDGVENWVRVFDYGADTANNCVPLVDLRHYAVQKSVRIESARGNEGF